MFNIVIAVLDSVRAANCSLFGYGRRTNPGLEELAPEFVVYKNAFSTTISTVPAHASLFTGTHVSTHGLFVEGHRLTPGLITLAEFLAGLGYATFGICYQDDVSPVTGLHRGFGEFHMDDEPSSFKKLVREILWSHKGPVPKNGQDRPGNCAPRHGLMSRVRETKFFKELYWMATRNSDQGAASSRKKIDRFLYNSGWSSGCSAAPCPGRAARPFFMYVHYDEAHLPYRPPSPFRSSFLAGTGNGKRPAVVNQDRTRFYLDPRIMDEGDFNVLRSLYDGSILYLDSMVSGLYRSLKGMGLMENTMFIVLSDHGDHLGEHGLMSHKYALCDHLTRVPLMIKYPGSFGIRGNHEGIVQITDIFPTIADALGVPRERIPVQLEGNSLISGRMMNRAGQYAVSELMKPFGKEIDHFKRQLRHYHRIMYAVRGARYKCVRDAKGRTEIFDLMNDPEELNGMQLILSGADGEIKRVMEQADSHLPRFRECNRKFAGLTG